MLEQVLKHINNYFGKERYSGTFSIVDGKLTKVGFMDGQYFRIEGSVLNDGVYKNPTDQLADEVFEGSVTALAIPKAVIALTAEIAAYCEKNPDNGKISESFGGYSYQKAMNSTGSVVGWKEVFASRLNDWRKL